MVQAIYMTSLLAMLGGCRAVYVDERARSPHFKDGEFKNGVEVDKNWLDYSITRINTAYADWPKWIDSELAFRLPTESMARKYARR